MARLPQPGGDNGNWGTILNDYLTQAHQPDGMLKNGGVSSDKLSSSVQASLAKADTAAQPADLLQKVDGPQLYNPAGLRRWLTALDGIQQGSKLSVTVVGHSIAYGKGSGGTNIEADDIASFASWVARFRRKFFGEYGDTGEGWILTTDTRCALGGAPSSSQRAPFGRGRRLGTGQTLTITLPACVGYEIAYWQDTTSATKMPTHAIDGGSAVTDAQSTGANLIMTTPVVSGLAHAPHTLQISGPATGYTYIVGIRPIVNNAGVVVNRFANAGYVVEQSISGAASNITDPLILEAIQAATWDLTSTNLAIIQFTTNDQTAQTSLAAFKASHQKHLDRVLARGGCALLLADPENNAAAAGISRAQYVAALHELADANTHVSVLDIRDYWGSYAEANSRGLYQAGSTVHPSMAGHGDVASIIYAAVTSRMPFTF